MKSRTSTPVSPRRSSRPVPPYLLNTEPMEPEAIPLQLALLTMEVRSQREALERLSAALNYAGHMTLPPGATDA